MLVEIDGAQEEREISTFLKTFEGAAATFELDDDLWSLWLPEMTATDRPITPASQLYFAVILRRDEQAFAIRFFYDCSTGKIRYYTSAVPTEIAQAPRFEDAVSELFRHTLPVEPIRQRKLRGAGRRRREKAGTPPESKVRPVREIPARMADPVAPSPSSEREVAPAGSASVSEPTVAPAREVARESNARQTLNIELTPATPGANPAPNDPDAVLGNHAPAIRPSESTQGVEASREGPSVSPGLKRAEPQALQAPAAPVKREKIPTKTPAPALPPTSTALAKSVPAKAPADSVWSTGGSKALTVPSAEPTPTREVALPPRSEIAVSRAGESPTVTSDFDGVRKVEFDVGARMRSVLMSIIYACGIVATIGIIAYSFLVFSEDPGVKHHRLQNEAQAGRASR